MFWNLYCKDFENNENFKSDRGKYLFKEIQEIKTRNA